MLIPLGTAKAKVGHRQTPLNKKAQPCVGLFYLVQCSWMACLNEVTRRSQSELLAAKANIRLRMLSTNGAAKAKVGHRQTPYK